jgi:hypothetical protein
MLIHPKRCKNNCQLYVSIQITNWNDYIGFCMAHGGNTKITNPMYLFLQNRGCCTYDSGGRSRARMVNSDDKHFNGRGLGNANIK